MIKFRALQKKYLPYFLALITTSFFVFASPDLETARATLTRAIENWHAFTPKAATRKT